MYHNGIPWWFYFQDRRGCSSRVGSLRLCQLRPVYSRSLSWPQPVPCSQQCQRKRGDYFSSFLPMEESFPAFFVTLTLRESLTFPSWGAALRALVTRSFGFISYGLLKTAFLPSLHVSVPSIGPLRFPGYRASHRFYSSQHTGFCFYLRTLVSTCSQEKRAQFNGSAEGEGVCF